MCLNWLAASFCFYLISYELKYLPGDIFKITYFSGASDLIANLTAGLLIGFVGLKPTLFLANLFAAIGSLLIILWGWHATGVWTLPILVLITKLGISTLFTAVYLGNALLFPTLFTATSMGICNIFARSATIGAPEVAEIPGTFPLWVVCIISACSMSASLFL